MAASYKLFFALSMVILMGGHISQCQQFYWSPALAATLDIQVEIVDVMSRLKTARFQDPKQLENWGHVLWFLPRRIMQFEWQDYSSAEPRDMFLSSIPWSLQKIENLRVDGLFKSQALTDIFKNGMGKLAPKLRKHIQSFLKSSGRRYKMPYDTTICPSSSTSYKYNKKISITEICSSVMECSSKQHPYGGSSSDTDATAACTTDKKCDLEKALPMMVGVFWHAMNEAVFQLLCVNVCHKYRRWHECDYDPTLERLKYEAKLLKAFTSALPQSLYFNQVWNPFFQEALKKRAFSKLDEAMTMIEGKKDDFDFISLMCNTLKFAKACPYADIQKELVFIKNGQLQRRNPRLVKDLRLQSKVDHAKMAQLQRDTVKHIELLGTIKKLDENLEASVSGISEYFRVLAKYDEGIANADVTFIQDKLNGYEKDLAVLETKLNKDFKTGMTLMTAVAVANLAEQTALLIARIVENCNPLRVIFGGSEPGDIAEQAAKVANAASKLVRASALFASLNTLATDSAQIGKAFHGEFSNKKQLSILKTLVDKIRKGGSNNIEEDADKFVKQYSDYTPQIDRTKLAHNNALWSAFKDAMCEILHGEVGIAGSVPQSVAGGMLLCEYLEGTLAQFFTLREEIFDFQFQLIDALTMVVRGNIAKRLAQNIKGKGDVLPATELMLGFLMVQNRIQAHSSVYCDKLEYRQLGTPIQACSTVNGLFSKNHINTLIAYTDHSRYDKFERDVYIPTKPRSQGDTGYLDLNSLSEKGEAIFKLPADNKWLQKYRWTLNGETTIPFVEKFDIFFPLKEYKTGSQQEHTTTRVTITSIAGSAVSTAAPNTSPVYVLPPGHSSYVTVYEEGYSSCTSSNEINNPYSLCKNLPKICLKSTRQAGDSLLPTILSTWSVKFSFLKGSKKLTWDAPKAETNLLIRAKVTLRMLPSKKKRSLVPPSPVMDDDVVTKSGCCDTGNRYRNSLDERKCKTCPTDTTSKLRGLYCQINESSQGGSGQ